LGGDFRLCSLLFAYPASIEVRDMQ
jgi:hypothetical protein